MLRESFDRDWFVARVGSPAAPVGPVTVPYDAMLFEKRDPDTKNGGNTGFFPGGVYRYTTTFVAPESWAGQAVILEFEGVYERSEVSVNGRLVGGRPSGYALFHVPIHEHLVLGGPNTVEVVADNSHLPNSRWYSGSGIYRPVHLLVGGPVRIAPTGLRLSTSSVVDGTAEVRVQVTVVNDGATSAVVDLDVVVAGVESTTRVTVAPGSTETFIQLVTVADAPLWSPDSPVLSAAHLGLRIEGDLVDEATEDFGIRIVTADVRNGLQINGATVKLRGAAIHHDNGVIGAHTLDAAEDRRIRLLKASGYNAIRSAHNPASRALLRACDRHGVLVMDELTDAWFRPKSAHDYHEHFEQWWERDLEALVANAHNHPSVVMYSIGNEISETATPRGIEMNRGIAQRTRELDPTRLVTNGINGFLNLIAPQDDEKLAKKAEAAKDKDEAPNKNLIRILNAIIGILDKMLERIVRLKAVDKRTRDAFADLDVAGYNYMVGRYELDGKLHPERLIVGSETRASLAVDIWKIVENLPYVLGDFAWTGWDYVGEAGLATKEYGQTKRQIYHPYPALLAGEPVIDITGFRQSQSYLNEIAWHLSRGPHLAVEPVNHSGEKTVKTGWRATNSVPSWSWEGCDGRTATVEVYADAPQVELLINGRSLGRKRATADDNYLARFTLPYEPGELVAVAFDADGTEIGRDVLVSAGSGLKLHVVPETDHLVADGADLLYLPIELTDDAGIVRPLADRQVTIAVTGAGALLGFGSAQAITTEAFDSPVHSTYYGRAQAVIRAAHEAGDVAIVVSAEGCDPVSLTIPVHPRPSGTR
jgi:beta-galactosidase